MQDCVRRAVICVHRLVEGRGCYPAEGSECFSSLYARVCSRRIFVSRRRMGFIYRPLDCNIVTSMASFRAFRGMLLFESLRPVPFVVAFYLFSSLLGLVCRSADASARGISWPSVRSCGISRSFTDSSSLQLRVPSVSPFFLSALPRRSELCSQLIFIGHVRSPCCSADSLFRSVPGRSHYRYLSCLHGPSFFRMSPFVYRATCPPYPGFQLLLAHQSPALISPSFTWMLPDETGAAGSFLTPSLLLRGKNPALKGSHDTNLERPEKRRGDTAMIRSTLVRLLSAAKSTHLPAVNAGKGPVTLEIEKKVWNFSPTPLLSLFVLFAH
ncbi:hypothetical protein CSUI_003624 [Cystoisospora suis]|uniref:Uncharacterized protein n=1 Tax=Cystoisospora suis TaxID=483139 RepID=A0A2C6KPU9_9APIC|nr:hypothetical protein CSUI_003624 [Cystoisospora suis]